MLKQYLRSSIIVLFQFIGLALLSIILIPLLFEKADTLSRINHFLAQHKSLFLLSHAVFYLALYVLWPNLVRYLIAHRESPTAAQIQKAIHTRYYLILAFNAIELLNLWR